MATFGQLPEIDSRVRLYTVLIPREDALQLFGFFQQVEREIFLLLTSVSGVGPKIALGILSSVAIHDLQQNILMNDVVSLQKMQGVGKKTAERILIELRDKIGKVNSPHVHDILDKTIPTPAKHIQQDAVSALIALGYAKASAEKAVRETVVKLGSVSVSTDIIIKNALNILLQK
jgi:Holliday junction DNA helicase RuvA